MQNKYYLYKLLDKNIYLIGNLIPIMWNNNYHSGRYKGECKKLGPLQGQKVDVFFLIFRFWHDWSQNLKHLDIKSWKLSQGWKCSSQSLVFKYTIYSNTQIIKLEIQWDGQKPLKKLFFDCTMHMSVPHNLTKFKVFFKILLGQDT